jgi:hypothetical protein
MASLIGLPLTRRRCCWKILAEQTDGMGTAPAGKEKSRPKTCGAGFRALLSRPDDSSNNTDVLAEKSTMFAHYTKQWYNPRV